jgi:pimeloyl-ACP methyl ester carboxylesterase
MKVRLAIAALLLSTSGLSTSGALALECGGFEFPQCDGPDQQFAGGFKPDLPLGGFGGGECQATRTPVVFVHGNADRAISWDSPASDGGPSVYATLRAGGYNDCELFGVTYLSPEERDHPAKNDHNPEKYQVLTSFLEAVTSHAGQPQVDVVAHSLGSSLAIAALDRSDSWGRVRRFINIAGGLRGLGSCLSAGPANPLSPTCAAGQPARGTFGFYPDVPLGMNPWTGDWGMRSLRLAPQHHASVLFYTLTAGVQDQVHCGSMQASDACAKGPLFSPAPNVRAQLNVGAGTRASAKDFDWEDKSVRNHNGGDQDGVGHYKARNNSGAIVLNMLATDCSGLNCAKGYRGSVEEVRE